MTWHIWTYAAGETFGEDAACARQRYDELYGGAYATRLYMVESHAQTPQTSPPPPPYLLATGATCPSGYQPLVSSWQDCQTAAESLGYSGDSVAHVDSMATDCTIWGSTRSQGCYKSHGNGRFHFNCAPGGSSRGDDQILCVISGGAEVTQRSCDPPPASCGTLTVLAQYGSMSPGNWQMLEDWARASGSVGITPCPSPPSHNGTFAPPWALSAEGTSCDDACAAVGRQCNLERTLANAGSEAGVRAAAAAVGRSCNGASGWSYVSGPGICTHPSCCLGDCVNICVYGSADATCNGAEEVYSRLCYCDEI